MESAVVMPALFMVFLFCVQFGLIAAADITAGVAAYYACREGNCKNWNMESIEKKAASVLAVYEYGTKKTGGGYRLYQVNRARKKAGEEIFSVKKITGSGGLKGVSLTYSCPLHIPFVNSIIAGFLETAKTDLLRGGGFSAVPRIKLQKRFLMSKWESE